MLSESPSEYLLFLISSITSSIVLPHDDDFFLEAGRHADIRYALAMPDGIVREVEKDLLEHRAGKYFHTGRKIVL